MRATWPARSSGAAIRSRGASVITSDDVGLGKRRPVSPPYPLVGKSGEELFSPAN